MLNENAKKWVAALRSGEYEQGRGCLQMGGKFCCLGVACEIYQQNAAEPMPQKTTTKAGHYYDDVEVVAYNNNISCCPLQVMAYMGIDTILGKYWSSGNMTSLAAQNDLGSTFAEIADIIESEPQGLFV